MLLIGNGCLTEDEERTQMAIWSLSAAPLIMGNDPRNISAASKAILTNTAAIAVDQDPLGQMGLRLSPQNVTEVWARTLADGAIAVALYNKLGGVPPAPPCASWNVTTAGYYSSCGGVLGTFSGLTLAEAQAACCANPICAGVLYDASTSSGDYHADLNCGYHSSTTYSEYSKPGFVPPAGAAVDITVSFADVNLFGSVRVYDIWSQTDLGVFEGAFTATVPFHGSAFVRLTQGA